MTLTEPTTSTVVSADGTRIAYERCGTGPAVVLVDGACCYRDFGPLRGLAQALAADFTVYVYDRRGRGASTDTLPYAIDREVDDLVAVLDAAADPASVYGVSSGALLGLRAAGAGTAIRRLAMFEPPIGDDYAPAMATLASEIAALVIAGRRGDAVECFQRGIGVPPDVVSGMRHAPGRPMLEAIAHTLVYDCTIADGTTVAHASAVSIPALVIDSEASAGELSRWATSVTGALPHGEHESLPGQWHTVADEVLAPVLARFFAAT